MKLFECQNCGQLLYFENRKCERCGHRLGYIPEQNLLSALEPRSETWVAKADPDRHFIFCANADDDVCNWLVPADSSEIFCMACRHNGIIPNLSTPANLLAWRKIEAAKHRLIYTLLRLDLPLSTRGQDREHGLIFDFLADDGPAAMTGHDNGVITIALKEADDAERERRRTEMGEPYRTLLGHFRHEVGHHYWDLLVRDSDHLQSFRALFGDERDDYGAALLRHYEEGPQPNWQQSFVSAYATSHPWEDFAETWAHYLHIVDTLEMAASFGLSVRPRIAGARNLEAVFEADPYGPGDIRALIDTWLPLTFALNSLNQTMGQPDVYPFILSPEVIDKLEFIHALVRNDARPQSQRVDQDVGANLPI
ncbi:zinc-binding metallopeptidase family protein [Microvirga antarctica]|uniref:zinc-binding metallopeptidase family protein n=1 Tax=Microvirga antarctica TaxID=2819233 RepID=UPI001B30ACA8|nr:putative zinc-binding peptidase [Microvirga antarctica]